MITAHGQEDIKQKENKKCDENAESEDCFLYSNREEYSL